MRLNFRNRPKINRPSNVVSKPTVSTSKREASLFNTKRWIDSDGRHFIWMPKKCGSSGEFSLRKNPRRRPTHRGRRKRCDNLGILLKKFQSTISQLVPEAKRLPLRIQKLVCVLWDAAQFSENGLEVSQSIDQLTASPADNHRHRSRHKLSEGVCKCFGNKTLGKESL